MKMFLILIAVISLNAAGHPKVDPFGQVRNDACFGPIKKAIESVQAAGSYQNPLARVTLTGVNANEREYTLKFLGLAGHYQLVLDNDPSNRCFLLELEYVWTN